VICLSWRAVWLSMAGSFYPLFRLGEEQVYRVVEAAATTCYRQFGGSKRRPAFADAIDWLLDTGVIHRADAPRWEAARKLRNIASHSEQPTYMTPGAVLTTFETSAHDINRLFARANQKRLISGRSPRR
jgi:hypothetical protein